MPAGIRARFEASILRLAAWLIASRGVARSRVISRQDNNALFEMPYEIRKIARDIESGYQEQNRETEAREACMDPKSVASPCRRQKRKGIP